MIKEGSERMSAQQDKTATSNTEEENADEHGGKKYITQDQR